MNLHDAIAIASSGMKAQSARMRVAAENLANADTTGTSPGEEPYRRKTIHFQEVLDRERGIDLVDIERYGTDPAPFPEEFDPSHPAANRKGYVALPNVRPLVELMDMREAQRTYEANLNAMSMARSMLKSTLDLLR